MAGVLLLMKIGWRNLWRNPRRTLLTMLALGLGLALLLLSVGLLDGSQEQRVANRVRLGAGHVVVQAKGYQDTHAQDLLLPAWVVPAIKELLYSGAMKDSLREVSPRFLASGLLSSAADASGVSIFGVIPKAEASVSLVSQRIIEGTYLSDEQPSGVVIGAELARKLEVKVGSKVVLMIQAVRQADAQAKDAPRGEMQSTLLRVRGIFRTGLRELDTYVISLPLPTTQTLFGAPEQVTQVAIFLAQEGDSLLVARLLREQLTAVPTEVLTWRESLARLAQIFWLESAFNYVIGGILLVMVGLGVLNTILMAVLERRYEFGVCTVLGLRPGQLAGLIVCESLVLTLISLVLGLALGLGVHRYFATSGLDLRWFFETSLPAAWTVFDPILYPRLSLRRIAWSVGVVFMMALAFSLYPALKAARTELPDALQRM